MIFFQSKVYEWVVKCFGISSANSKKERNHRFLEEALELVQSTGCSKSEAHQLVDYVFDRPVGEPKQEMGGVMVTLAALASANDMNIFSCGNAELDRIRGKIDDIRKKQELKPKIEK